MTRLYLITGFLGAGKTTFLKEFIRLFPREKLAIVINEFGKEDVDGCLLSALHGRMEAIHSGSIFCACRLDQFEQAMLRLLSEKPDVVVVETSGLSDPSNLQEVLDDLGQKQAVDYRGCICVADALNFVKVYTTAMAARKQVAMCDAVVLNKTDLATPEQKANILTALHTARPAAPILETYRGRIPEAWRKTLLSPALLPHAPSPHTRDLSVQSYILNVDGSMPPKALTAFLERVVPFTHRIKGFVRLSGTLYLADCVGCRVSLSPYTGPVGAVGRIVVLAGQGQPAYKALTAACKEYGDYTLSIEK